MPIQGAKPKVPPGIGGHPADGSDPKAGPNPDDHVFVPNPDDHVFVPNPDDHVFVPNPDDHVFVPNPDDHVFVPNPDDHVFVPNPDDHVFVPDPTIGGGAPFDDSVVGQLWGLNHPVLAAAVQASQAAGTLAPIGLNAARIYAYEAGAGSELYAPLDAILADVDQTSVVTYPDLSTATVRGLGVGFLRQGTEADVLWPADVPVPVRGDVTKAYGARGRKDQIPAPLTRDAVYWALQGPRWDGLHALFSQLGASGDGRHPLRVVLTFLTLGANNSDLAEPTHPPGVDADGAPTGQSEYKPGQILAMDWSLHVGLTEEWDTDGVGTVDAVPLEDTYYSPRGVTLDAAVAEDQAFVTGSLDLRSRYKLVYCYHIGKAVAQLLLDLQSSFNYEGIPVNIFDHVLGIELGNEVNHANAFFINAEDASENHGLLNSGEDHATLWARAVREGVRGMQEAFAIGYQVPNPIYPENPDRATLVPVSVPLWLPSIAGYYRSELDPYGFEPLFTDILEWQRALLSQLPTVAAVSDGRPSGSPEAIDLTWFTNEDYHYYHYAEVQNPGHVARLVAEIAALRANVAASADFSSITCSLAEGGASTDTTEDADGYGVPDNLGYQSFPDHHLLDEEEPPVDNYPYLIAIAEADADEADPASVRLPGTALIFQGREVWRRLCAALALGIPTAWHTHRDSTGSPYFATGLRNDSGEGADGTFYVASSGDARPSWWALQRLIRLVGIPPAAAGDGTLLFGGAPQGASMTTPTTAMGTDYYQTGLDRTLAADMVVIYAFQPASVADYVYVILTDPTASDAAEFVVSITNPFGATVWQVPSVPSSLTVTAALWSQYYPESTPSGDWNQVTDSWPASLSGFTLTTRADMDPIVLLSSAPLVFAVS